MNLQDYGLYDLLLEYSMERVHWANTNAPVDLHIPPGIVQEIARRYNVLLATYDECLRDRAGIGEFIADLKDWESLCLKVANGFQDELEIDVRYTDRAMSPGAEV